MTSSGHAEIHPFPATFKTETLSTNGAQIYVRVGGSGPAVVMLHGYGETGDMWESFATKLAKDHTVVVPDLRGAAQFEGAGIYYGATFVESQLCRNEEAIVVGGGNSAGQAAVFLTRTSKYVHMLVRSEGLAASMSRYLIRRIEENPAINLRTCTEIVSLEGNEYLERVAWRDNGTGKIDMRNVRHIFVMTGAIPNTAWLGGCVLLDAKGFIKTGPDLSRDDLMSAHWPLTRSPHLLETSLPGVFAVGDVRSGNVKRVASAVGEGSIAVASVHQVLRE